MKVGFYSPNLPDPCSTLSNSEEEDCQARQHPFFFFFLFFFCLASMHPDAKNRARGQQLDTF